MNLAIQVDLQANKMIAPVLVGVGFKAVKEGRVNWGVYEP